MHDGELLTKYISGDPQAFAALVKQYIDMVHAGARRQAAEHADDVTQAVFILLARKAAGLQGRPNIAGWLLTTTRLCASRARRSDLRRRAHEREAGMQTANSAAETAELLAMLDAGLEALPAGERELVIGRHLRGKALEVMAEELGVTVPATTKRVQRALERLRGIFARRGKSVGLPALAGILAAEAGHRAPAALAARAPSAVATAIANSVPALLLGGVATYVAAAVIALIVGAGVTAGILLARGESRHGGPAMLIAATAAAPAVESASPHDDATPILASFDLAMDGAVAEKLRSVATPVESRSESYSAYRASSNDLITLLREGLATEALYATDESNVFFYSPRGAELEDAFALRHYATTFSAERAGTIWIGSSNASKGGGRIGATRTGLSLDVDLPEVNVWTATQTIGSQDRPGSVRFKGEIASGETLFFLREAAPVGGQTPWHGIFWQSFRATRDQATALAMIRTLDGWIPRGPDRALAQADRALVWRHSGADDIGKMPMPRGAVRQLANGAEVRLVALGRPQEFPFCWWTGDGTPLPKDWTGDMVTLKSARAVVVEYSVPAFTSPGWSSSAFYGMVDPIRYYTSSKAEVEWSVDAPLESVRVGISCGPWEDAGTLKGVGTFRKGDLTLEITKIYPIDGIHGVMPAAKFWAPPEMDVRLLVVDKAGKAHDWVTENEREIKGSSGETVGVTINPAPVEYALSPNFTVPPEKVDHYLVQTRKREWATFEHLPDMPRVEIPAKVTAEAAAAVRERIAAEKAATEPVTRNGK